jgi:hypothetical protein
LRKSERKALALQPDLRNQRELFAWAQLLPAAFRQHRHDIGTDVVPGLRIARAWVAEPDC